MAKKSIPKPLRISVWEEYNGEEYKAKCYCCKREIISTHNFECGHIISEKNGGATTKENLRPICGTCNKSMSITNMDEFIEKFGFNNINNINNEEDISDIEIFESDQNFISSIENQSIKSLIQECKDDKFDLNPIYQRDVVWTNEKKSNFINSIIRRIIPNPIIINTNDLDGMSTCIDGKQRLTSILDFVVNKIPLIIEDTYIYYDEVKSDENKKHKKCRTFRNDERNKFLNMTITTIKYKNLNASDEREIFQRIQNGCVVTYGETILSMIKDINACKYFKEYCDKNVKYLEKFLNSKKKYKKTRGEEYEIICCLLYLIDKATFILPSKKQLNQYIEELTLESFKDNKECMDVMIQEIFDKILSNEKTNKMNKIMLYVIAYNTYKKTYQSDDVDYKKCIRIINKIIIESKEIEMKRTIECYRAVWFGDCYTLK